jgi:tRNA A-37 threonylcarbamoyl transferase component Bud32
MNFIKLNQYKYVELKKIANDMNIKVKKTKNELINDIIEEFKEYEEYKKNKIDKYLRKEQLGNKGKEGITYLVINKENNKEYAMKTFKKIKSSNTLKREYILQKQASKYGVAPKVIEYDTVSKYIVMEKMDESLMNIITKQKGNLHKYQQLQLINIYNKLDEAKVFHNDANLTNYMVKYQIGDENKKQEIFLIDYGLSREITPQLCKKLNTNTPNIELMLLGFILKLKSVNCPETSYIYLKKYLKPKICEDYKL